MSAVTRTPVLEVQRVGCARRFTLDRPPLNVLDTELLSELARALGELARDGDAKLLVLTGRGTAFCAGVDVADHAADRVERTLDLFHGVIRSLLELPIPVIAALNGHALGGGCELALACDLVIASEGAKLGQPEIGLGVFPPVAAVFLPRLLGAQRALDLILTGRTVSSTEAQAMGLVTRVVAADRFAEEVTRCVERLSSLSGPVLRMAKRAVRDGVQGDVGDALARAERLYLTELMRLRDPHEGIAAFLEKRSPVWSEG
jgi:cyclohexa-1,5-dienecarbonyl-CoA hydratase